VNLSDVKTIGCPFLLVGDEAGLDLAKQAEGLVGDVLDSRVHVDKDIKVSVGDVGWDVSSLAEATTSVVNGSDTCGVHPVNGWSAAGQDTGAGHLGASVDESGCSHVPDASGMHVTGDKA
tara:strand:- start:128 stop:487 length:360 start_codon:yes stop_codon:yes gene_type:complete